MNYAAIEEVSDSLEAALARLMEQRDDIQKKINILSGALDEINPKLPEKRAKPAIEDEDEDNDGIPECLGRFKGAKECVECPERRYCVDEDEEKPPPKPTKPTKRPHPSLAPNAGLTEAIRGMMSKGGQFSARQVLAAMSQRFKGLTLTTVHAVLGYNVTKGRMRRTGRKGFYKYGLKKN